MEDLDVRLVPPVGSGGGANSCNCSCPGFSGGTHNLSTDPELCTKCRIRGDAVHDQLQEELDELPSDLGWREAAEPPRRSAVPHLRRGRSVNVQKARSRRPPMALVPPVPKALGADRRRLDGPRQRAGRPGVHRHAKFVAIRLVIEPYVQNCALWMFRDLRPSIDCVA